MRGRGEQKFVQGEKFVVTWRPYEERSCFEDKYARDNTQREEMAKRQEDVHGIGYLSNTSVAPKSLKNLLYCNLYRIAVLLN